MFFAPIRFIQPDQILELAVRAVVVAGEHNVREIHVAQAPFDDDALERQKRHRAVVAHHPFDGRVQPGQELELIGDDPIRFNDADVRTKLVDLAVDAIVIADLDELYIVPELIPEHIRDEARGIEKSAAQMAIAIAASGFVGVKIIPMF
jgi:hypothetical protein